MFLLDIVLDFGCKPLGISTSQSLLCYMIEQPAYLFVDDHMKLNNHGIVSEIYKRCLLYVSTVNHSFVRFLPATKLPSLKGKKKKYTEDKRTP